MKQLAKRFRAIAYLFSSLLLFQSCVAYRSAPTTVAKAELQEKGRIKIKTIDGKEHVLRWIEDKGDHIVGIRHTEQTFLPIEEVAYIKTTDTAWPFLSLDSLTTYKGEVAVTTLNKKGVQQNYEFIQIQNRDSVLQGVELLKNDTATVIIPREQIASIKLENRGASTAGNLIIGLTGAIVLISIIAIIDINRNGLDIDLSGP